MNAGVEVVLLPPNQAGMATNATMRGGFIFHRPPFLRQTFNFNGDADLETAFKEMFFQGASVHRPDFGLTQILVQGSGRLYRLTNVSDSWTVEDITIPGDPNDPAQPRAWFWQSEKWTVCNDGSGKLPIIYDGVTARRSYGPSVLLGTTTAGWTIPAIGSIVQVTLVAPYTGPFNVPVITNGAFYQTIANATAEYNVTLTNFTATPGTPIAVGDDVMVLPNRVGYVVSASAYYQIPAAGSANFIDVTMSAPVGQTGDVIIGSKIFGRTTLDTSTTQITLLLKAPQTPGSSPVNVGDLVTARFNLGPSVLIGEIVNATVNPAVGGTVAIELTTPYSGPSGAVVWIGDAQYSITAPASGPAGTTLNLLNLNDTGTNPAVGQDILSVPELPPGRMGTYARQRNIMSLVDGLGFIVGDIAGGASGTQAENYRDSVLKVTENDFLFGGGTFRIPSSGNIITAIVTTANLDTAFGQGDAQICTDTGMWGLNLPTDRSTWATLTTPLLPASLIGYGPLNHYGTILSNSDVIFRQTDGMASLKFARRDFNQDIGGNTPISREVSNVLDADDKTLLAYGSAITHDNRLLMTSGPLVTQRGVINRGLIAFNFDLVSSLRGKAPPIYDGLWTGLNTFQVITGNFSGVTKSYAFGWHQVNDEVELFEIGKTGDGHLQDNDDTDIEWSLESPPLFRPDQRPKEQRLVRLLNGQLHIQDISGLVTITVKWRPDFNPCWQTWHEAEVCGNINVTDGQPGYRTIGLGEPPPTPCEEANNRPYRVGRFHQVRIEVTGSCKIMAFETSAMVESEDTFVPPLCESVTADDDELLIPVPS